MSAVRKNGQGLFVHSAEHPVYAMSWSVRLDAGPRLAVGSFVEQYRNKVLILRLNEEGGTLDQDAMASFEHPYPPTHTAFVPSGSSSRPDLLATSADVIRIWKLRSHEEQPTVMSALLKDTALRPTGAVTCFDWNDLDLGRIASGSTNGILTSWDVERSAVSKRVKVHDGDVFDCQWGAADVVTSCSSDASVRLLDLRDEENCTVLFESARKSPVVRLDWNKMDPRFMAVTTAHDGKVLVLDVRRPNVPVLILNQHLKACNAIHWSPHVSGCICTASDDGNGLIWCLGNLEAAAPGTQTNPDLVYSAGAPINQIYWSPSSPDWLGVTSNSTTRVMRVA
jgi:WD repeat-containing protein 68